MSFTEKEAKQIIVDIERGMNRMEYDHEYIEEVTGVSTQRTMRWTLFEI